MRTQDDVLFFCPATNDADQDVYREIIGRGINPEQVVRIRVNANLSVFKIYP
jgi:hypothetical protein